MQIPARFGGSIYILRIGLAATILIAAVWIVFFSNWSELFHGASAPLLRSVTVEKQPKVTIIPVSSEHSSVLTAEAHKNNIIDISPLISKLMVDPSTSPATNAQQPTGGALLPPCPEPYKLVGPLAVNFEQPTFEEIAKANPLLKPGGHYSPPDCKPRNGPTAIIVPYRNREPQLRGFLHHMHPILQRQLLEYVIIVVDQAGNNKFNRALLMNIGYKESLKLLPNGTQFQCYIFHDVDLLPEDDQGLYTCSDKSIHLSGYIDKFDYKIPYGAIFGGASAIPKQHFELINGFSNVFFGWGGEDDDIHDRLLHLKLPIIRYEKDILRYKMFKHEHESTNAANDNRMALLRKTVARMHNDGLNTLTYKLVKRDDLPTHTHVVVEVVEEDVYKAVFGVPKVVV